MKSNFLQFIICAALLGGFFAPLSAFADNLPLVRASYRPDGWVLVTVFAAEACRSGEEIKTCMDRIYAQNAERDLPYDDMRPEDLPDRSTRNQWRGAPGRGVWVDETVVTRIQKRDELQTELDAELDQDEPDPSKVLKLQRLIERVNDMPDPVLSEAELASLEQKRDGIFTVALRAVGRFFSGVGQGIRNGVLALTSLVTDSLRVGSPSAPSGITVYDTATGEPYCVIVEQGAIKNVPGECGSTSPTESSTGTPPLEEPSSEEPPPPPEETPDTPPPDTEAPVITIEGNNPAVIMVGESYVDLGATVADNVDQNLGIHAFIDGTEVQNISLDTSNPGTYIVVYRATDQAGNTGEAIRTVEVVLPAPLPEPDPESPPEEPPTTP